MVRRSGIISQRLVYIVVPCNGLLCIYFISVTAWIPGDCEERAVFCSELGCIYQEISSSLY